MFFQSKLCKSLVKIYAHLGASAQQPNFYIALVDGHAVKRSNHVSRRCPRLCFYCRKHLWVHHIGGVCLARAAGHLDDARLLDVACVGTVNVRASRLPGRVLIAFPLNTLIAHREHGAVTRHRRLVFVVRVLAAVQLVYVPQQQFPGPWNARRRVPMLVLAGNPRSPSGPFWVAGVQHLGNVWSGWNKGVRHA